MCDVGALHWPFKHAVLVLQQYKGSTSDPPTSTGGSIQSQTATPTCTYLPHVSPPPTLSPAKSVLHQIPSMDVQSARTAPSHSPFDHPAPSLAYREAGQGLPSSSSLRAFQAPSGSGTPNNPRSASAASLSPSQRGSLRDEMAYDDSLCMPLPPAAPDSAHKRSPSRSPPVANAQGPYAMPRPSPTRLNGHFFGPSVGSTATAAAASQWQAPRRLSGLIQKVCVCHFVPWILQNHG